MQQQEADFNKRIELWVATNGYKLISISDKVVEFERLSDAYPFAVDARLIKQLVIDDGF